MEVMTMRKILTILLMTGVLAIGIGSGQQKEQAEVNLQAAIRMETVEGDLKGAIEQYKKIAAQPGAGRATVATALLRMGQCHEKLGNAEARTAYERLVSDYADQAEQVKQARVRLAALAGTARAAAAGATKDLTLTKIYAGSAYAASISPDGKRLALIRPELSSRDIWIRDIATGKEVRLTNLINSSADAVWSPDSQWIAFADRDRDIKVVPTDGGPLRTLFTTDPNSRDTAGIAPTGWTSDSKKVIFHVPSKGLFAVPAAGGASEPVRTFENPDEAKRHEAMTLSPDGRWIAYSATQNGNTDIFVMSTTGRGPIRVTANPAADRKPRWSRDGNWLAFTSSGTENPQIWAIKISPKGEPEGLPVQISKDAHVLGGDWTGGASVGFSAAFRTEHIFTANVDGTGETQLTQFASFNAKPRWSPNGDRIAFRSDYRKPLSTFQLWTVSSAGGTPRLVSDKEVGSFLWSGDGEKLFFKTGAGSDRSVYMEVPARGGEPKEIMPLPGDRGGLSWSPDGRSLGFTFAIEPARFATTDEYLKERLSGIGVTPIGGGEPRILIPADKKGIWYSDCRLDPEGKRIAYIKFDYAQYEKEGMYSIWTMDVNGGTPRQITQGGEYSLCWSPDAKWIVFEKRIKDMDFDLYKVPANGGEPVKMNIKGRSPEFSPDGKRIAFSRRVDSGYEYWLGENFLPPLKVAK
jgi:Tol biopolymer transport system component